ncbi:hypothetical protein [Paenibacillus pinihumi]|uniref:hypothetical protein n=1 Tax=Paenibacillus pinihumi TaxID=669462 RepID=UPI00040C2506|nr:hypothetical protein [Paenibacillus pinihumi]
MDRKTLEYMEMRSQRAREIVGQIDSLLKSIDAAKKTVSVALYNKLPTGIFVTDPDHKGELPNDFYTELTAIIINVYIDMVLKEIHRLEKEFAEL